VTRALGVSALLIVLTSAHLTPAARVDLAKTGRARVLTAADKYVTEPPITITASRALRSPDGPHDFFSEGDYWWPDPAHPDGPYIGRDGESNPNNFVEHRRALMRLSVQVPALAAAWLLTHAPRRFRRGRSRHDFFSGGRCCGSNSAVQQAMTLTWLDWLLMAVYFGFVLGVGLALRQA
jgi:hypothetical protein